VQKAALFLLPLVVACGGTGNGHDSPAPPADEHAHFFPPGTEAGALAGAIDEGLRSPGKGPDFTRFVVIADGDRYGSSYGPGEFQAVAGAGVRLPAGSLQIRRRWDLQNGANIDGRNEEFQTLGVTVCVERGAARPYAPEVARAVTAFVAALTRAVPIHPDCVVGMAEIPYVRRHEAEEGEKALAFEARRAVPVPAPQARLAVEGAGGPIDVEVEVRDTNNAIRTGMMMRTRFDGANRGMLFVYPAPTYHFFHMRNCLIPIDLAYLRNGRVDQILRMEPASGADPDAIRHYTSRSAVRLALEMPAGWFEANGVKEGAPVQGLPE